MTMQVAKPELGPLAPLSMRLRNVPWEYTSVTFSPGVRPWLAHRLFAYSAFSFSSFSHSHPWWQPAATEGENEAAGASYKHSRFTVLCRAHLSTELAFFSDHLNC